MNQRKPRLRWIRHFTEIIFDPEEPWIVLSLTPVFPGCAADLAQKGIVWDLQALIASVSRPGGHDVLNCECGYPPDAYLQAPVAISHPDDQTVIWEMDCEGLRPTLDRRICVEACHRLVFDRADYEASIRAMVRDVQAAARTPLTLDKLRQLGFFDAFVAEYPGRTQLPIGEFEPSFNNTGDIEEVVAVDASTAWPREPLFTPDTLVEIGVFGSELLRVNGQRWNPWIGRLFTRWDTAVAFRAWMSTLVRRFASDPRRMPVAGMRDSALLLLSQSEYSAAHAADPNAFVLATGHDMESAHTHGERFARALAQAFAEGATAPGVRVVYVRSDIPEW